MAGIGTKGLFARGVGIVAAAAQGLIARGFNASSGGGGYTPAQRYSMRRHRRAASYQWRGLRA